MTPFAIISLGRDGSTLLQASLDLHPAVRSLGEVLCLESPDAPHPDPGEPVAAFLARAVYWEAPSVAAAGCKLVTVAGERADYDAAFGHLRQIGARLILMRRRGLLARHVSWLAAMQTARWYDTTGAAPTTATVWVDPAKIEAALAAADAEYDRHRRDLCGLPSLEVAYESLAADYPGTLARVWRFLGVPPHAVAPPLHKQERRPLREAVTNWPEVAAALGVTGGRAAA